MSSTKRWASTVIAALTLSLLAACGGGGGGGGDDSAGGGNGGGGGGGDGGGGGTNPPGSTTLTYFYRSTPMATDVDTLASNLAAQGAEGYRYVGPASFGGVPSFEFANLYAKDVATYAYRLLDVQAGETDALAQLNAQGAEGYKYYGDLAIGPIGSIGAQRSVYVRDQTNPGNFEYRLLDATNDRSSFLAQANGQGGQGYWYISGVALGGGASIKQLYMTDKTHADARYEYRAVDAVSSRNDLSTQLNEQGGQGYRFKGPDFQAGNLYVRDTTQNATFTYQIEDPKTSAGDFVNHANELGGSGFGFLTTLVQGEIFVRPENCSGYLCTVLHPLTQN